MLLVSFEPGTLRVLMLKTEGLSIARSSEFSVVEIDLKFCIGSKLKFEFFKNVRVFRKCQRSFLISEVLIGQAEKKILIDWTKMNLVLKILCFWKICVQISDILGS